MPSHLKGAAIAALSVALVLPVALGQNTPAAPTAPADTAAIAADLRALLANGPRVAGSEASTKAIAYLETQFRALGYETRRDTFSYDRFDDLGSDVRVGEQTLRGFALQGSGGGTVTGAVARVPGTGTPQEFAGANVRGKIAVVARGGLRFVEKARNAAEAGALGLIVVNNDAGPLQGTLGESARLPVLGLARESGDALKSGATVTLNVRAEQRTVQAQNVVAFKAGVTKPELLFGGHLDSVPLSPGANDNASGTAAVLDLARRAVNTPLAARSFFVLFDGEEDGLRGSRAFVEKNRDLVRGLKAMMNFDMVGVNVSPLAIGGDEKLAGEAGRALNLRTFRDGGGSDHGPFLSAGVAALFFHRGIDANYHKPGDLTADPALVRETTDAALKVVDLVR